MVLRSSPALVASFVLTGAVVFLYPTAAIADQGDAPMIHFDLDVSLLQMELGFLDSGDLLPECVPGVPCSLAGVSDLALRGAVAVGLGGVAVEATITSPLSDDSPTLLSFSGGLRFDTSRDAIFSVQIRLAYVYRWGDLEGMGGRAGFGLVLRPVWWISGYAEASVDVTSVPTAYNEMGAILAHATYLGGGVRLSFGP